MQLYDRSILVTGCSLGGRSLLVPSVIQERSSAIQIKNCMQRAQYARRDSEFMDGVYSSWEHPETDMMPVHRLWTIISFWLQYTNVNLEFLLWDFRLERIRYCLCAWVHLMMRTFVVLLYIVLP